MNWRLALYVLAMTIVMGQTTNCMSRTTILTFSIVKAHAAALA